MDTTTLQWAATWIEDSLTGETDERVIEFGRNMAMTIRAAQLDTRANSHGERIALEGIKAGLKERDRLTAQRMKDAIVAKAMETAEGWRLQAERWQKKADGEFRIPFKNLHYADRDACLSKMSALTTFAVEIEKTEKIQDGNTRSGATAQGGVNE